MHGSWSPSGTATAWSTAWRTRACATSGSRCAPWGPRVSNPDAGAEELARAEAERLANDDLAILLDVRPTVEYEHGHLPGAISMPVEELPNQVDSLPHDRRIIAYCRGDYCLFADEAVAILRRLGFDAVRLDGGWLEWSAEA